MFTRQQEQSVKAYDKEESYLQSFSREHKLTQSDVALLAKHGYLSYSEQQCEKHKQQLTLSKRERHPDGWELHCSKCRSDATISIRINNPMLYQKHYSIPELMTIVRLIENKANWNVIAKEAQIGKKTVSRIYEQLILRMQKKLDELLYASDYTFDKNSDIQVDEAKLKWQGKKLQYSFSDRGEQEKGDWILGFTEKKTKRVYFRCVLNRKAEELIDVIEEIVEPGATITTDALATYECLKQNYIHKICNKKLFGFCTCSCIDHLHINVNCIECQWKYLRALAHSKSISHPEHVPHLVLEYMFRSYKCDFFQLIKHCSP